MLRTYALGLEAPEHENVQFLTMKPSHDESSVYDSLGWTGAHQSPLSMVCNDKNTFESELSVSLPPL